MEKFIQRIGKKAGEILLKNFKFRLEKIKERAGGKNLHTKQDFLVEDYLIKEIKKKYPHHSILGEERGKQEGRSNFLWLIDPLDGTNNFVNHNPFFSLSICLFKNNQPYLAYIYAPALDEIYFAKKGFGSFRNGKRIKVSKVSNFKDSYLCFCEGGEKRKRRLVKIFQKVYPKVLEIRKLGSAALECAWVASGRAEGYFSTQISPWDVAAGVLLVEEAGGKVTNFKSQSWRLLKDDFIASNGKIHSQLVRLLKNS